MKSKRSVHIRYRLLYGVAYSVSLLPFGVLYFFSDILYFFACHLFHYRRKVIRRNIKKSFPQKTDKERLRIERSFYHYLCDYFVETIKMISMSRQEIARRMRFENTELIHHLMRHGNSCFVCLGHYANWEWVTSMVLMFDAEIVTGLVYKKLNNVAFDRLFRVIRSRFGSVSIERKELLRTIVGLEQDDKTMLIGFLSDQRPPRYMEQYWTRFLNQDTLVETGVERIARKQGYAVVYADMTRVKRGYYTCSFSLLTVDASQESEFAVMEKYMRKLEKSILRDPAFYLWSHNRWKFQRQNKS